MKVLIACEYSGAVRNAFIAAGHNAVSCDLLPTDAPGPHYQGSVLDILHEGWDMMVAHPPCTYLCNSGVRWLTTEEGRWEKMRGGAEFFAMMLNAPIPRICVENPIMHKHAVQLIGCRQNQVVQPWQFGHGETKATGLWLRGLPRLMPSSIVEGREHNIHNAPPTEDRWKFRSTTYEGIALAMAKQWGNEARLARLGNQMALSLY
jgi:hypothetical protein